MPAARTFLPSRDGFAFANSWPAQPALTIATPLGRINVGNARGGLCGGMVFAALDYWYAGQPPPGRQPAPGDPLYRHVVRRLVGSWRLPAGVARYYRWMTLSDGALAARTTAAELPRIRADLDRGAPVPLGVVTVASANPARLPLNHQVLAYGYEAAGDVVTLRVYDPNRGNRDDVVIRLDTPAFAHNLGLGRPVRGVFRVPYTRSAPPS